MANMQYNQKWNKKLCHRKDQLENSHELLFHTLILILYQTEISNVYFNEEYKVTLSY